MDKLTKQTWKGLKVLKNNLARLNERAKPVTPLDVHYAIVEIVDLLDDLMEIVKNGVKDEETETGRGTDQKENS